VVNGYKPGAYQVPGLSARGVLITAVTIEDNDLVMLKNTINGRKILYTAGAAFGSVGISGELLLGSAECGGAGGVKYQTVVDWFNTVRVSKSKTPINVSVLGVGYKVFITGMGVSQADPEYNLQGFTIIGTLANPPVKS
jgi:hypothetical protein